MSSVAGDAAFHWAISRSSSLRGGDGLGVARGDLSGGFGAAECLFGLGGEEVTIALGLGIARRHSGSNACSLAGDGPGLRNGRTLPGRAVGSTALAVGGQAGGNLLAKRARRLLGRAGECFCWFKVKVR